MIEFISLDQALYIHHLMISKFGGLQGIRDINLLISALETPKATFGSADLHPTLYDKAAAYMFHLTKNHPFNDGNKRTAYFVTLLFLKANHVPIRFEKEQLEAVVVSTAEGRLSKEQISSFLSISKKEFLL